MHALCCLSPLVTEAEIWIFPAKVVSGNCSTSTPQAGLTVIASAGFWKTETQSQVWQCEALAVVTLRLCSKPG